MKRAALAVLILGGCAAPARVKLDVPGCENVHRLSPKLLSGGEPKGEAALAGLAALGVRTILSVDGAKPDAELAAKLGMRYVHLPIGYDGIPEPRAYELARAVRDLEGPIYVHCHHGLHRGPAAAAAAMVALGECPAEEAVATMKALGTSPRYKGLYDSVLRLKPSPSDVSSARNEFPAAAKLPGFTAAMADLDRRWEHMAAIRKADWKASSEHPDIDPPHEALQIRELFTEMNRMDSVKAKPGSFRGWLTDSQAAAEELETAIRGKDAEGAGRAYSRIESSCKSCHETHRNNK